MKNWFVSLKGAITLSVISLLVYLGRAFIDFYYVFGEFGLDLGMVTLAMVFYLALFGGWIWALLVAVQGSRRGLYALLGFDLFFLLFIAVLVFLMFGLLPLTALGLVFYIGPTTQLLVALLVFREPFDRVQALAFGLVWAGLLVVTWDSIRRARALRRRVGKSV